MSTTPPARPSSPSHDDDPTTPEHPTQHTVTAYPPEALDGVLALLNSSRAAETPHVPPFTQQDLLNYYETMRQYNEDEDHWGWTDSDDEDEDEAEVPRPVVVVPGGRFRFSHKTVDVVGEYFRWIH